MIQRILVSAIGALALMFTAASAAEPLTEGQVKRFVATLELIDALGDELEAEGKIDAISVETEPQAGEAFKPYSHAVEALKKKYPADHAKLDKIVQTQQFSAEEWGVVGDRVMIAYMALRMQEEDPQAYKMMDGMDKSMIEMVPPEMRAQLEQTFAMMETIKNASAKDKLAILPVKKELDAYMDHQEAKS